MSAGVRGGGGEAKRGCGEGGERRRDVGAEGGEKWAGGGRSVRDRERVCVSGC